MLLPDTPGQVVTLGSEICYRSRVAGCHRDSTFIANKITCKFWFTLFWEWYLGFPSTEVGWYFPVLCPRKIFDILKLWAATVQYKICWTCRSGSGLYLGTCVPCDCNGIISLTRKPKVLLLLKIWKCEILVEKHRTETFIAGKSTTCDPDTGLCLGCRWNFLVSIFYFVKLFRLKNVRNFLISKICETFWFWKYEREMKHSKESLDIT